MPLAPLAVPSAAQQDIAALEQVPAAELFLQRARAADASFALTPGDAPAVAELCRRLDGLPLALELAAARVRIGGPRRLLAALERGLDTLGSGRVISLRVSAAFEPRWTTPFRCWTRNHGGCSPRSACSPVPGRSNRQKSCWAINSTFGRRRHRCLISL